MSNETNVTDVNNVTDVSRETNVTNENETPPEADTRHADDSPDDDDDQHDTFPRTVVEKLRKESAGYRERARDAEKRADDLAAQLHRVLVERDGRLADADDLEFNPAHLDNPDALGDAITELIRRKPHLKARRARGDIGAGDRGPATADSMDLLSIVRGLQ